MDEREMFEAHFGIPIDQRRTPSKGSYALREHQMMWAGWQAGRRTIPDREAWISVDERLPDEGQAIAFVVHWPGDEFLHGRVLGGTFHSYGGKMPTFSVPGTGFKATHWMPLPTPPRDE